MHLDKIYFSALFLVAILVEIFSVIDLSGNYVTTNTVFNLGPLNGMDFKFASHGLWSEKQNILPQHMLKKGFWILTNKCGNNLKLENEAEWP